MRKALCTTADQSKAQRAVTTNHHREAGTAIVPPPAQENKEENMKNIRERLKEEILLLTPEQLDYVIERVDELLANEEVNENQKEAGRNG